MLREIETDEEHAGRARLRKDGFEQLEAIGVGPLHIIDAQDERRDIRDATEQLLEGVERAPS